MLTVALLSATVPLIGGTAYLALRGRLARPIADQRGIALQTVVVIAVLLVIAATVAGVLLARGGDAVDELENTDVTIDLAKIKNETLCDKAGGAWAPGTSTCS